MTSVRLPTDLERKLEMVARKKRTSKTNVIREALENLFTQEETEKDSYELGEEYFGKYGSGDGSLSTTYKNKLKEKLHGKYHSH
ncbi:CopG-like domain-containing protein DNA-binding [uncultured spirochete]|jgi:Arc/MetJ-type ribon-helix-helix transcriptional regulator|uniref:CopG-like domain-containing protein DNA-binding n=1 Tax=uncultured spirochete TaxID=156406 RepID=A0A3P3XUS9_9SPIR|nr:CopG-like domain-containing protein DNA-binding [uncultured spirochete]SLM20046.1 CopG-like domain-containing protein DNA-binding [uncultured spirochete]